MIVTIVLSTTEPTPVLKAKSAACLLLRFNSRKIPVASWESLQLGALGHWTIGYDGTVRW